MLMPRNQVVPIDTGRTTEAACLEDVLQDDLDGLYRFALRLKRNADEAQVLTQEAAVRAYFSVLEAQRIAQLAEETVRVRSLTVGRARAFYQARTRKAAADIGQ
jgi:hypothetical protein